MSFEDENFIFTRKASARSSVRMGVNSLKCSPKIKIDLEAQNLTPVLRRVNKLSLVNQKSPCVDNDEIAFRRRSESYMMAINQANFLQSPSTRSPMIKKSRIVPISPISERSLIHSIQNKILKNSNTISTDIGIVLI